MSSAVLERATYAPSPVATRWHLAWKKLALSGLVALAGVGAAWYGHHWWAVGRFVETTDDAYVGGEVTVVAPRVAGLIAQVTVTDNQAVHAGDLLVKLDDRDYRAALDKAAAAVAAAQATLANLDAVRRLREAMVAQAEAEVAAADAEVARSQFGPVRLRPTIPAGRRRSEEGRGQCRQGARRPCRCPA
jgi:membrane fusion protein, multidrug efflux system